MNDIPFDPDFDSNETAEVTEVVVVEQEGRQVDVDPRLAFWAGVVAAALGLGTVGFAVMLIVTLKG